MTQIFKKLSPFLRRIDRPKSVGRRGCQLIRFTPRFTHVYDTRHFQDPAPDSQLPRLATNRQRPRRANGRVCPKGTRPSNRGSLSDRSHLNRVPDRKSRCGTHSSHLRLSSPTASHSRGCQTLGRIRKAQPALIENFSTLTTREASPLILF